MFKTKYRIREIIWFNDFNKKNTTKYLVEKRFLLFLWDFQDIFNTLEKAKEYIEMSKKATIRNY